MKLTFDEMIAHQGKEVHIRAMAGRLQVDGQLKYNKKCDEFNIFLDANNGYAELTMKRNDQLWITLDEAWSDGEVSSPERLRIVIG